MNRAHSDKSEQSYGWVVVGVTIVCLGIANGAVNAISVFLIPLSVDLGWSRGDTAFAYMAATTCVGIGGIVTGYISDRYAARPVVLVGAVVLGASLLLLGRQAALWQYYLLYCLMGGAGIAAMHAPLLSNVGNWFGANKGLALGVTQGGRAVGNGLIPLLAGFLITAVGWRSAYMVLGLVVLVVMTPLALLVRSPPANSNPGATLGEDGAPPLGAGGVVAWVGTAALFCCVCMAVPLVHVAALAQDRGLDPHAAAGVLTVIMLTGIIGSVAFGKMADIIGEIRAYMLASACQTAMVFWFSQVHTDVGFYLLAVLFGLGYSGVMSCLIVCVRGLAPPRNRGLSLGAVTLFAWVGMGLGGYQGGYLFDLTGDYTLAFAVAAIAGVVNLVILSALQLHISRRKRDLQPTPAAA